MPHPINPVTLTLADGTSTSGLQCGSGPLACVIVGPGSFYLNKLSDRLKQHITFYVFDAEWTRNKEEQIGASRMNIIETSTIHSLSNSVANVVNALQKQFGYNKIGLMGFSAPGLIAFKAATDIGSDNIAFVIGSGIAATPTDPNFTEANTYFEQHASPTRKEQFANDTQTFTTLLNDVKQGAPVPEDLNVTESPSGERSLTPVSFFAAYMRSFAAKQIYFSKEPSKVDKLVQDFRFNAAQRVLCEPMRLHYFTQVLSQVSPAKIISAAVEADIPCILAYGEHDFTTPQPQKNDLQQWQRHANFFFRAYQGSIHYPSDEDLSQENFDADVKEFFAAHEISDCAPSGSSSHKNQLKRSHSAANLSSNTTPPTSSITQPTPKAASRNSFPLVAKFA